MNQHARPGCRWLPLLTAVAALVVLPLQNTEAASFKDFFEKKARQIEEAVRGMDRGPTEEEAAEEEATEEGAADPATGHTAADYAPARVKRIQYLLTELGYQPGPVDGAFGAATASAIGEYQGDHGLPRTRRPSAGLISHLHASLQDRGPATQTASAPSPDAPDDAVPASEPASSADSPPGSMVAPAPAGAARSPTAATTPSAAPEAAPLTASAAAASQVGLRVVRGRPMLINEGWTGVIESEGIASAEEIAAARRLLDHVRLGLNPDIARAGGTGSESYSRDSRAQCVANRLLDAARQDEVLQDAVDTKSGRERLRAWKGAPASGIAGNEFELQRAKQRFNELLPDVVAAAPRLPMRFLVVERLMLEPYDHARGGFPFRTPELSLPKSDCFGLDSDYLPIAAELPSLWPLDPRAGEALIQRIPVDASFPGQQRKVFVAMALTLSGAPESPIRGKLAGETLVPMKVDVDSVSLYEDPDLERHLHTFEMDAPAPAVLLAGVPDRVPVAAPVMLNDDTVALLLLKNHGDVLSPEAWHVLARKQSEADVRYYAKERHREIGGGTVITRLDGYDPDYLPFFPPGVTFSHGGTLNSDQLERFKSWTLARANALPSRFVLSGSIVRVEGGNGPDHPELQFAQTESRARRALQPVVSRGFSPDRIAIPELDRSEQYLAGEGGQRAALLLFPDALERYLPDLTLDQLSAMTEGQRWSWTAELMVSVPKTELMTLDKQTGYGPANALLLHVEPASLQVLGKAPHPERQGDWQVSVLHQQDYVPQASVAGQSPPETTPAEWDVLGIRLGISMEEAEKVIRQAMPVDRVYHRTKKDAALAYGYTVSRVFIGTKPQEVIALYGSASAPDTVRGVFRSTLMNRAASVPSDALYTEQDPIYQALTAKYGSGATRYTYYLRWGVADASSPCAEFRSSGLGTSESKLVSGTARNTDRSLLATVDFGLYRQVATRGAGASANAWSACGPVVVAHAWGEPLRVWLFDHAVAVPYAEREYRAFTEGAAATARSSAADLEL